MKRRLMQESVTAEGGRKPPLPNKAAARLRKADIRFRLLVRTRKKGKKIDNPHPPTCRAELNTKQRSSLLYESCKKNK